jgi:uncharacterized protein YdaT
MFQDQKESGPQRVKAVLQRENTTETRKKVSMIVFWKPEEGKWKVKEKEASRASFSSPQKREAVNQAKRLAQKKKGEILVLRKDGEVDQKISRRKAKKSAQHVLVLGLKWVIQKEGSENPSYLYNYKQHAVDQGKKLASNQSSRLVVHRKDGSVQNIYDFSLQPDTKVDHF